jgi:hypothetical protein
MKEMKGIKVERRGRPKKQVTMSEFDSASVQLFRGSELSFNESLFKPMKTGTEIDLILSSIVFSELYVGVIIETLIIFLSSLYKNNLYKSL